MTEENTQQNQQQGKKEKILGIDLGTTNSQAAVMIGGQPKIVPSAEGATIAGKMFPSAVAFTDDGELLVGQPARRQAVSNPEGTITKFKRKMGTDHTYEVRGKEYTPQQISAFVLQKIKKDAEDFLGEEVEKAVITVPAYFDDNQRQATKDAGEIAGLEVVRIINEPTAASLAFGIDKEDEEHTILVFDFGGGTLDVTVLEFGEGVFEVKATSGDTNLGGSDMDEALAKYVIEEFKKDTGIDLSKDKKAIERLYEAAEKAKIELSSVKETEINLPYITADQDGPKHLEMKITRAKLEELVKDIVEKCGEPIDKAIENAKVDEDEISKVIMVGGPTRMPIVRRFVAEHVDTKPERGIDPMECVAMGAAIQGGVIAGEVKDIVLLDVTPLTLGIETLGGVMTPLIEANTTIPTKKKKVFTTAEDNQTAVTIHVVQGERPMAKDNTSLGQFNLVGIPPAPRGVPQIEVTFDIDANGILNVSAKDLGTGKEQKITITATTKLSDEEIEQMKKEAEKHAEEDTRKKERIETRNNADQLVHQTEKFLEDYGQQIPDAEKEKINKAKDELEEALKEEKGMEEIKEKMEKLSEASQEAGTKIYQQSQAAQQAQQQAYEQAQQQAQGPGQGQQEEDDENVVDADYKVED